MNNATRTTRREHERALKAEQRRQRNQEKKRLRLVNQGRTTEMRKPDSVRTKEAIIELYNVIDIATFERVRADLAIQALGGPHARPGEVPQHAAR